MSQYAILYNLTNDLDSSQEGIMPLNKGASNKAREQSIKTEIAAGKKPSQAEAIAYDEQRKAKEREAKRKHK